MKTCALFLILTLVMASEIAGLRAAIVAKLAGHADFAGVQVLDRMTGNIQNQIERALGKEKIVVIVITPLANTKPRQSQRPILDPLTIKIRVVENPLLNKTGKSAEEIAERALAILQWWQPAVPGSYLIMPADPAILELNLGGKLGQEGDEEEDYAGFDVTFETKLALTPAV